MTEATTADWMVAWTAVALAGVALGGFIATVATILITSAQARNRQQLEVEGYLRVDIGPTQGTDDYTPPSQSTIVFVERSRIKILEGASEDEDPTLSVYYRNLQTSPLGVILGIFSKVKGEITDSDGGIRHQISLTHQIPYLEPGKCVRLDFVCFPKTWEATARVEAIKYRSLHWDGATPKHGRSECEYRDGMSRMIAWSDPVDSLRDKLYRKWSRFKRALR